MKTIDLTNDYRINRALTVAASFLVEGAKAAAILAISLGAKNLFGLVWRVAAGIAVAAWIS